VQKSNTLLKFVILFIIIFGIFIGIFIKNTRAKNKRLKLIKKI